LPRLAFEPELSVGARRLSNRPTAFVHADHLRGRNRCARGSRSAAQVDHELRSGSAHQLVRNMAKQEKVQRSVKQRERSALSRARQCGALGDLVAPFNIG
jgi:hypothetical protein